MSHAHFRTAVSHFMSSPVRSVRASEPLVAAEAVLREYTLSSLAVLDAQGFAVGVLSRTDLLRLGTAKGPRGRRLPALELPAKTVGEVMNPGVLTVAPSCPVHEACSLLVRRHIHRAFVREGDALLGVFSTRDAMRAVAEARVPRPLSDLMSAPVLTVGSLEPLAAAVAKLEEAHVSGLLVLDEFERPAGLFTQVEALQARELPGATPVEEVMSFALLCLDAATPLHRAAAHAMETRARRVIAVEHRRVCGVLTGIDFARACVL